MFQWFYCSGILHISNIARARIKDVRDVFTIGEDVKVMVVTSPIKNRIAFRYFFLCLPSHVSVFRDVWFLQAIQLLWCSLAQI